MVNKIKMWSSEIATLSNIALSQPQAAYAAYTIVLLVDGCIYPELALTPVRLWKSGTGYLF